MPIKKIAIIGLGLIGGSLAKAVKHSKPEIEIAAFDYPEILELAFKEKNIDYLLQSVDESLDYEFIFICLPIEVSIKIFQQLSPKLKPKQIISDLCSVKGVFAQHWSTLNSNGVYIGAHPMAGKEKGGYKNSDSLLFENSVYIISNQTKNSDLISDYTEVINATGARVTFLDPFLHDKIVSKVSHLPQLLSVLLVNQAAANENGVQFLDFGAGGFRDMTRIAASDFEIWKSIIKNNKSEIIQSLSNFKNGLEHFISFINNDDYDSLKKEFIKARTSREEIPFSNKGFLSPLFDITIFVSDQPGMILKFSSVLYENNINIKDLELLKIREGSGGNFKLYFETESDAIKAKSLLEQAGFKTN
jgi:prephenate dehydrogenase